MPDSPSLDRRSVARLMLAGIGSALTHDFCPGANRFAYKLKHPLTILLVAALVSGAIGWSVAPQGYVVCASLTVVVLLGLVWPWLGMLGLSAELHFERRRIREGQSAQAVLTVVNRLPWPAWGLMLERGFEFAGGDGDASGSASDAAVALARVAGWSRSEFRWEFTPVMRGDYPLASPVLSCAFPFGLWNRSRQVLVASRLIVWPSLVALDALPLQAGSSWTLGALSQRRSGSEGEILGTRAFRPGDLLRSVHWAQTARYGRMIVCERQASLTTAVRVVLDCASDHHTGQGPHGSLAWALRIAASVAHAVLNHDARLMVALGRQELVIETGPQGEQRLNDALARFSPTADSVGRPLAADTRRGTALEIVVTTSRGAPAWLDSGRNLRRLIVLSIEAGDRDAWLLDGTDIDHWITLDSAGDVAGDLQQHWAQACHHELCSRA